MKKTFCLSCSDCGNKNCTYVPMGNSGDNCENYVSAFVKADNGKTQWSLLPFNELEQVVKVLELGVKKYSKDNWKKCDNPERYKDALMRHVVAYVKGDKVDNESGLSHLAHAVCNCLFLMWEDNEKKEE